MSEEIAIDPVARRKAWLQRICDEFLKLEPLFPLANMLPENETPRWVHNVEQAIGQSIYPVARLREGFFRTPRRMGALIGHSCAMGVWLMEYLRDELNKAEPEIDPTKFTPEQLKLGVEVLDGITNVWYPALRRLAKRALCSCVDQSYEDMTEFLLAYSDAFSRKPKRPGLADIGNPTIEIYFFMLTYWRAINALTSVHQLHQCLVSTFGPHRVGDLKRIEKICQRIELHYRKPGRPKKLDIIQTPAS